MQLGLIGLGKMGGNMRERLRRAGHEVVGFDRNPDVADVRTLPALVKALEAPRVVWVMVPAGDPTRETVAKLADLLEPGRPRHRRRQLPLHRRLRERQAAQAERRIGYVDCGVSGGIWGLENGYGLMCGGDKKWVNRGHADLRRAAARGPARGGLRPRRQGRRGALHEDGPQRHRVRPHGGLRRGLRAAREEGHRHRRPRRVQGVEPRHRRAVLAARPHGRRARGEPAPRRRLRLHGRLRRGPLDRRGGHRPRRADAGHLGLALRPVRLAPVELADDAGRRGSARPVRRAPGHVDRRGREAAPGRRADDGQALGEEGVPDEEGRRSAGRRSRRASALRARRRRPTSARPRRRQPPGRASATRATDMADTVRGQKRAAKKTAKKA